MTRGSIEATGRKAASTAIHQAEIDVAEQQKYGSIGVAKAKQLQATEAANAEKLRGIATMGAERERAVQVAELLKEEKIGVETAAFEQQASVKLAEQRDADQTRRGGRPGDRRRERGQGEDRRLERRPRLQAGRGVPDRRDQARARPTPASRRPPSALRTKAALAQAEKIEAEQRAQLEAVAKAKKAQVIVEAEAAAEPPTDRGRGRCQGDFCQARSRGPWNYEILAKKAEDSARSSPRAGGSQEAFQLLMLEHIDTALQTAAAGDLEHQVRQGHRLGRTRGSNGTAPPPASSRTWPRRFPPCSRSWRTSAASRCPTSSARWSTPPRIPTPRKSRANGQSSHREGRAPRPHLPTPEPKLPADAEPARQAVLNHGERLRLSGLD